MIDWIKTAQGGAAIIAAVFASMVAGGITGAMRRGSSAWWVRANGTGARPVMFSDEWVSIFESRHQPGSGAPRASLKGMREDKSAKSVIVETPASSPNL